MIGREKMRFGPGALKSSRDTVVVSVFWGDENSYRIALIRRSDAATAFVDIPQELRGEFARFDRDMVLLRAGELGIAVAWACSFRANVLCAGFMGVAPRAGLFGGRV